MKQNTWGSISHKSYLDKLSVDEVRNVLRHLSTYPGSTAWACQIAAADALSVLRFGGVLASCAIQDIRSVSTTRKWTPDCALVVDVTTEDDASMLGDLLANLAPALEGLGLSWKPTFANVPMNWSRFVSLRSLCVEDHLYNYDVDEILKACTGNLRELIMSGDELRPKAISAIAAHCAGLKKLCLKYPRVAGAMSSVWKAVGPSLEDLSCCLGSPNSNNSFVIVDEIASDCGNVSRFGFSGSDVKSASVLVQLCEKLGSQLRVLNFLSEFHSLTQAQCNAIVVACPDLRVDSLTEFGNLDTLSVFKDRVRSLKIGSRVRGDIEEVGKYVSNLEDFFVFAPATGSGAYFLSKFLSVPKPLLKSVHFDGPVWNLNRANEPFDALARVATSIEVLSVTTVSLTSSVFRNFAQANQRLQKVAVSCDSFQPYETTMGYFLGIEDDAANAAVSFVRDFVHCPILEELVLKNENVRPFSERIAGACVPFRGRGVNIFIGGRQYCSNYNLERKALKY